MIPHGDGVITWTHRCRLARFKMMTSSMRRDGEAARPGVLLGGGRGRVVTREVSAQWVR
jgi:hypothetical protein